MGARATERYWCEPGTQATQATLTKVVEREGEAEQRLYSVRVLDSRRLARVVGRLLLAGVRGREANHPPTPVAVASELDRLAFLWSTETHRRMLLLGDFDLRTHWGPVWRPVW